jgi:hypothetical protein
VREEVLALLAFQLADDTKARIIDPEQLNNYVSPRGNHRAQVESYEFLRRRAEAEGARMAVRARSEGAWEVVGG